MARTTLVYIPRIWPGVTQSVRGRCVREGSHRCRCRPSRRCCHCAIIRAQLISLHGTHSLRAYCLSRHKDPNVVQVTKLHPARTLTCGICRTTKQTQFLKIHRDRQLGRDYVGCANLMYLSVSGLPQGSLACALCYDARRKEFKASVAVLVDIEVYVHTWVTRSRRRGKVNNVVCRTASSIDPSSCRCTRIEGVSRIPRQTLPILRLKWPQCQLPPLL